MADNVAITAGSGTTVATDDCTTAGHTQIVKLAIATDGSATLIPAVAADGLLVNLGTNNDVAATLAAETTKVIGTVNIASSQTVGLVAGNANVGDVDVASIAAGDNNIGNVDIVTVPADPFGANADAASATGSISAKLRFIAATGIPVTSIATGSNAIGKLAANSGVDIGDVDITSVVPGVAATSLGKAEDAAHSSGDVGVLMLGVRNSAHTARTDADGDYTAIAVDAEGCVLVVGNVAHDAADSDPPIKIGARAIAGISTATLVAANDRTNLQAGLDGVLIVRNHCGPEDIVSATASNTDGARFTVLASSGAGIRTYLTQVTIANTSTAMITCSIDDATTSKYVVPVPAQGGVTISFDPPLRGTADSVWACDPSAANTTTYASMCGFKSKA